MIKFDEPGDEFELEAMKKVNHQTKLVTVSLFVVLLLMVVFIAKNDFKLDFSKSNSEISFQCDGSTTADGGASDEEARSERAMNALRTNLVQMEGIEGFKAAKVSMEPIGYQRRPVPVVKVFFSKIGSHKQAKLPDKVCGFDLISIYQ